MFEKKDVIFSENLGVCQVHEIAKLSAKNGEQVLYYGLRSVADNKKVAYIPVEHHSVLLRPLISYEEALKVMEDYKKQQEDTESGNQDNTAGRTISDIEKEEAEYVISHHDTKSKPKS